jgi:hypothetical protein
MTLLTNNSIFQPSSKLIRFTNSDLCIVDGVNVVNKLNLHGFSIKYEQYLRTQIQIPAGQTDYVLHFPTLGIQTTMVTIKPTYNSNDPTKNYLRWKFQSTTGAKWSMTNLMVLTGTSQNPIPPILLDNPNTITGVTIDVLVAVMTQDYLNDMAAFIYLHGLTFDKIHTLDETTSEILAFFNSSDELAGTINISDVVTVTRINTQNRIIIDEASERNVVLDFATDYDTKQALSALNWVILDPASRSLPQAADTSGPVVTLKNIVVSNAMEIDLALYNGLYTRQDFIDDAILSVVDARDGAIVPQIDDVAFKQSTVLYNTIVTAGTYTATLTVQDIAGNTTTHDITINAVSV